MARRIKCAPLAFMVHGSHQTMSDVTIAIPTYRRGSILTETLQGLLALPERAAEIIVADQTPSYEPEIEERLVTWARQGEIRWMRLPSPSIPHAMNEALRAARTRIVLYVDDDIIATPHFVAEHERAYEPGVWAVVGQVLQPGE